MSETTEAPTQTTPDAAAASSSPPTEAQQTGAPPADATKPAQADAGGDLLDNAGEPSSQSEPAGDLLSDDGNAQPEGVPDQYTFEPPEGLDTSRLDEAKLDAFKDKAKELGLTQDQFQQVLEYDIERTQAAETEAVEAWQERVKGWREAASTDKEIGGEAFQANLKTALGVVEQFGDPDLRALIKSPSEENPEGLAISNHPAFLRFLNRIGKAIGDPNFVQGDGVKEADSTEARLKRLYPSMFKEDA